MFLFKNKKNQITLKKRIKDKEENTLLMGGGVMLQHKKHKDKNGLPTEIELHHNQNLIKINIHPYE